MQEIVAKNAICNANMMLLSKLIGVWFGASLAIDVEARAKFSAKLLTRRVGLDVGRTVFAAFHKLETVIVIGAVATRLYIGPNSSAAVLGSGVSVSDAALACASGAFLLQMLVVAPVLNRRVAAEVDDDKPMPKSTVHIYYVLLEGIKLAALLCV